MSRANLISKIFFVFILIIFMSMSSFRAFSKGDKEKLRPKYAKWLQEAQYIMTKTEKKAFEKLKSDEQRDRFIKAFWDHRDPTQGTPRNEYKEEHYRRWNYANTYYGRGTSRPGWMTDMGRTYILLGEPIEVRRFTEVGVIFPAQLWFYAGNPKKGLPGHFYLVFYKRSGTGEYRLYSPFADNVRSLISDPSLVYGTETEMYWAIRQNVDGEMADAAFNLVPGEYFDPRYPRATFRSQDLLNSIDDLPNQIPEPLYAQAIVENRPVVELEYRYRTLELDFLSHYFRGSDGDFFLYYGWKLPPQKVSLGQYEDKYYFSFKIDGQIKDTKDRNLLSFKDEVFSYLSQKEFEAVKAAPISYQNRLAITQGFHTLNFIVSNPISKEYGSIRNNIYVPDLSLSAEALYVSQVLQGFQIKRLEGLIVDKPFQFDNILFSPNFSTEYLINSKIYLYFQIYCPKNLEKLGNAKFSLKYTILQGDKELSSTSEILDLSLADIYGTISQLKEMPLTSLQAGQYRIKISLLRDESDELASREVDFSIINESRIFRPLVLAKKLTRLQDFSNNVARALIYNGQDNLTSAIQELEQAIEKKPDNIKAKKLLAQLLVRQEKFRRAIQILNPLFVKNPHDFEVVGYLAVSHFREGNFDEAIRFYEIALRIKPSNTSLLNAAAQAYLKKGDKAKALEYFGKSVALNPDQPEIRKEIGRLKP